MDTVKVTQKTISFHLHGFWYHLDPSTGKDQHGDRWIASGHYFIHEHNSAQKVRRDTK
jgi:hypothetical protein